MSDNLHPLTTGTDLVPTPFEDVVTPFTGTVGTDFLMFGVGGGANIEAQTDYLNDPQRPTGNLPGLARSNFNNKAIRQGTFVAHSLCLWISQQIQVYIPDDGNDIAWIGEFTQALSSFLLALLPPGPNMGAYLPLSGGNMFGNITFNPGISTILANNTWYFGRDTAGTARGLMIKGGDNNIYINDGTCPYVMFNGSPIINNNIWYGARSTTGSLHGVIGLLSDNNTHINTGPGASIFLDCATNGSVWTNGNIVLNNGQWYYSKTADASPRAILGISTGNELQLGGGHPWVTGIYAGGGQWIYMHANVVNILGQLIVNQYSYLNAGGRAYIPGGNDPWQIYSDNGFYARTHFIVGGTRDWTAGCLRGGTFGIADESAAAMRFEIDLSGNSHVYGNFYANDCNFGGTTVTAFHATAWAQVDGGLTVYNSLNVASGNLTVSGGSYLYGGSQVWNGLTVQSGGFVANAGASIAGGMTVYNSFNMASGTIWVNGPAYLYSNANIYGALAVGGTGWIQDIGGNWLMMNLNLRVNGGIQVLGGMTVQGGLTVYDSFVINSGTFTSQVSSVFNAGLYTSSLQVNVGGGGQNVVIYGRTLMQSVGNNIPLWLIASGGVNNCAIAFSLGGAEPWTAGVLPNGDFGIYKNLSGANTFRFQVSQGGDIEVSKHCYGQDGSSDCGYIGRAWLYVVGFNIQQISDPALKRDISPAPARCLDLVRAIEPKVYKLIPKKDLDGNEREGEADRVHWGFLSTEVGEVMQRAGHRFDAVRTENGISSLAYNEMIAVLWSAVRELAAIIEAK